VEKRILVFIFNFIIIWFTLSLYAFVAGANILEGIRATIFGIGIITLSAYMAWLVDKYKYQLRKDKNEEENSNKKHKYPE